MAINRYVYPYEILFRLMQSGEVQGCHRRDIEVVKDDDTGEIFSTRETDPTPISGEEMELVLGAINTALVASLAVAEEQVVDLKNQLYSCQAKSQQIAQEHDAMVEQLAQANETIDQLTGQVQELLELHAGTATGSEITGEQALTTNE